MRILTRKPALAFALLVLLPIASPPGAFAAEDGPRLSAADDKPVTLINAADGSRREDAGNLFGMGLYMMDGVGGTCVRLCRSPTTATGSPDLSRDGKRVAFDGWDDSQGEGTSDSRLFSFEVDNPSQITELGHGAMPSWAAGSVGLTFSAYRQRGVHIMDADGGGRTPLDRSGWSAEWSPDGAKIAYTSYANGGANVVVYNVLTGEKKPLFERSVYSFISWGFAWSPDSQQLGVLARTAQQEQAIVVIRVEGDGPKHRVLTDRVPEAHAAAIKAPIAWGGDGQRVMYSAPNITEGFESLYTLDVSGDADPEVVPNLPSETHCFCPQWNPDGAIVFVGTPLDGAGGE